MMRRKHAARNRAPDGAAPRRAQAHVALSVPCGRWRRGVPGVVGLCRRAAHAALAAGAPRLGAAEVSILLADDALLRVLNRDWRGKDRPTNVLAFPGELANGGAVAALLGDVVVGYETSAAEARAAARPLADHLAHLVVHGVLHLLGHDHRRQAEAQRMERLETRILAGLGVPDPYAPMPRAVAGRARNAAGRG
jgi:probable rRNA maturation factor